MSVTLAPQITAAPQEIRTPIFPLPLRCGLELLEPKPHTIADTISARTLRMRPMVITAPTMVRSWLMPGRPESFGSMSMSIGTSAANEATVSVARVRMVMAGRSFVAPARGVLASRCAALPETTSGHPLFSRGWPRGAGNGSELSADADEPVHPGHAAAGEDRRAERDEDPGAGLAGGGVVPGRGGDGPGDARDDEHQHRDHEHERQQGPDDLFQVADPCESVEVGEHAHHAPPSDTGRVR